MKSTFTLRYNDGYRMLSYYWQQNTYSAHATALAKVFKSKLHEPIQVTDLRG